jgi:hypothetical protein
MPSCYNLLISESSDLEFVCCHWENRKDRQIQMHPMDPSKQDVEQARVQYIAFIKYIETHF